MIIGLFADDFIKCVRWCLVFGEINMNNISYLSEFYFFMVSIWQLSVIAITILDAFVISIISDITSKRIFRRFLPSIGKPISASGA